MTNLQLVGDLDGLLEQVRSAVVRFNGFAVGTLPLPTSEDSLNEDDTWLDCANELMSLGEALSDLGDELEAAARASAEDGGTADG